MVNPALLALMSPVVVGCVFKLIGQLKGQANLAPEVLASFMMMGSMTGLLLAVLLDNAGGAWDNAKKYVETGQHGGKVFVYTCQHLPATPPRGSNVKARARARIRQTT
jgi:Na+/H+-translocating membrane pyrophosphatase